MQTIYTTGGCVGTPFKIQLLVNDVQRLSKAKELLINGAVDSATIEIPPFNPETHFNFIGKVSWLEDERMVGNNKVTLRHGLPRVEVGHECHEGFMANTETRDVLEQPPVWFESEYLRHFLIRLDKTREPWDILEPEHQLFMMPALRRVAVESLAGSKGQRDSEWNRLYRPHWRNVAAYTKDILDGKRTFDELIGICRMVTSREAQGLSLEGPSGSTERTIR